MDAAIAHPDALSALERRVVDDIDGEEPWALLERFSDLHRVSGSEDERRAADYLCDRLDAFGVEYDRHEPELYISQPHGATLRTLNRTFEPGPVKTVSFSASTTVSAEVAYVGSAGGDLLADDDPRPPYHDVPAERVEGKIALTEAGSLSIRAASALTERGAVGVIAIHEHDLSRVLTRLTLVSEGQYEQDPAVSRQPVPRLAPARLVPSLDGDDARFMGVQLKRESNAVVAALREARGLLPDA